MAIKRPDIYEHNNPNDAFVDSDFVRGGIRTTADTISDLYALSGKTDQLKVYVSKVYVVSEQGYYILTDINNVDNINGWTREDVIILSNINGLTATTISATTYNNLPLDIYVTGGTYSNGNLDITNNTGGTFTISGFSTGGTSNFDVFVTGGTYSNGVVELTNNTGGTFTVNGLFDSADDVFVTGLTINNATYDLSIIRNDGVSIVVNLGILATDMTITGGTYNPNNGVATFTNNSGGTFNVSGFLTGQTDTYVTAFTYNNNTLTLKQTNNETDISVLINEMSGLTVNGVLSATTYYGLPIDVRVTGGTYSNGSATFINNTGGTFTISGFSTGGTSNFDVFVTGATFDNTTNDAVFTNNTGGTFTVNINTDLGGYVPYIGATNNVQLDKRQFIINMVDDAFAIEINSFADGTPRVDIGIGSNGGGFINLFDKVANLVTNIEDGQISTNRFVVYGGTSDQILLADGTLGSFPFDVYVTGGTYNAGTATFVNNTGGTFNVTGFNTGSGTFTGGTVSGPTVFTAGLSANTISATTYFNLPLDIRVTGGTYSSGTAIFTNNTGGTFSVAGFSTGGTFTGGTVSGGTTFTSGLSANTISATTYVNLPVTADTFTTAFTYSNNVFTLRRNQGLSAFTATINTMTGLTINGALTVTGATALNGAISSTGLSGTTDRLVEVSSGGTVTASKQIISAYLTSGGTVANLLENTANWDIDGVYTGTSITGTYQGQKHYNGNYFFEAVADNLFIRLIRG